MSASLPQPAAMTVSGSLRALRGTPWEVFAATAAVVAGAAALLPLWARLYPLWNTDPLRAIGALFPLLSLFGVLLAWRRLDWQMQGRSVGFALVAVSVLLARIGFLKNPVLALHGHKLPLIPWGALLFLYGVGAVLVFGGTRLLRAALPPLLLLLAVNPVPHWYNAAVDLPLQHLSANTARGFAHLIGLQPTGEQLRMMFAPTFGMMIVPGCDGLRGSVTLAYLSLIFGYARGLRGRRLAFVTLGALLAGFVLNLLRLCLLVVYYRVGLSVPAVQPYGTQVDYLIGGSVFLAATVVLGSLIRNLAPARSAPEHHPAVEVPAAARKRAWLCAATLAMVGLACAAPQVQALRPWFSPPRPEQEAYRLLPQQVGSFRLTRTYGEHYLGSLAWVLGDYEAPGADAFSVRHVTLGFWLKGADHTVAESKAAAGGGPVWTGRLDASRRGEPEASLLMTAFREEHSLQFNAETVCSRQRCAVGEEGGTGALVEMSQGSLSELLLRPSAHLPVLLRHEYPAEAGSAFAELRSGFQQDARDFLHDLDLREPLQQAPHFVAPVP